MEYDYRTSYDWWDLTDFPIEDIDAN